ncbi:MAG: hypothetical protein IPK92_14925 [Nitrospira sp.]|nr:hypothetical protein [Nitrospira sp.]
MTDYQNFATTIATLLGGRQSVRITSGNYMALCIESIGHSAEGNPLISLAHYGVQNGDLMADPEMTFEVYAYPSPAAEPMTYRNDYLGVMQEVYEYSPSGKKSHIRPQLKKDLRHFAALWFRNLKTQGFLSESAVREIRS